MNVRSIRPHELTPESRIANAKRKLADAIDELVEARLAKGASASEWIDQAHSPLGRDRHLRLVRAGVLKATKLGRRRLVRRSDIDAYMEQNQLVPPAEESDDDVAEMMRRIAVGGRR